MSEFFVIGLIVLFGDVERTAAPRPEQDTFPPATCSDIIEIPWYEPPQTQRFQAAPRILPSPPEL
jgi:hypothetical protein